LRFEEGAIGEERMEKHQRRQVGVWYCGRGTVAKGDTIGESEGLGSRKLHGFTVLGKIFTGGMGIFMFSGGTGSSSGPLMSWEPGNRRFGTSYGMLQQAIEMGWAAAARVWRLLLLGQRSFDLDHVACVWLDARRRYETIV
jgi:hypothetical protein